MWFTPGMVVAAVLVYVVYEMTGRASQWWLWLCAVVLLILVDVILGWYPRRVPDPKMKTIYEKKKGG